MLAQGLRNPYDYAWNQLAKRSSMVAAADSLAQAKAARTERWRKRNFPLF